MIHQSVTQAVGKRVVGRQNILPLLRDAAEDAREVKVCVDTEKTRYTGQILAVSGNTEEHVILKAPNSRTRLDRTSLKTQRILAFSILEVGPDPESPAGKEQHESSKD